ncbi:hypothetical protein GCM10011340_20050 [Roseivirga thermotolerans]|uniref:Uncharacterized protein n=1 Tax=Roseivirga thermotolerans TaxID=1758176 RepID=A0ABQ3I501_9BACT|nr:hypothetical protein GCM10011340_20050 [Roseivirga thermotolerans]
MPMLKNQFLKMICFFKGHVPKAILVETDIAIYTRGCSRCKAGMGVPHIKNIPPPPGSSAEETISWEMYKQRKIDALRAQSTNSL